MEQLKRKRIPKELSKVEPRDKTRPYKQKEFSFFLYN